MMFDRPDNQFYRGMRIGFQMQVPQVRINRVDGQIELRCYVLPAFTLCHEPQNVFFPIA
jgi:hypothetical protein